MRRSMTRPSVSLWLLSGFMLASYANGASDILEVHEWGTFTELQDEAGVSIGGINTDDEPVPSFVHRISDRVLQSTNEPFRAARQIRFFGKAISWNRDVATRLETPVIYFYPPAGQKGPMTIDVDVQLRGGWLSEYYPNAKAYAPGIGRHNLNRHAVGMLSWHDLKIGASAEIPETNDHVWLAPRKTQAARVGTPEGEAEQYLFYRGVGAFSGPLRVETDYEANRLRLQSRFHTLDSETDVTIPAAWLVHIKEDGSLAYRSLDSMTASRHSAQVIQEIDRSFEASEFATQHFEQLKKEMHDALVEDGLFADEATAMLSTWERAYFRTPGLRLFYLVPQQWTDDRMPLTLSVAANVQRVMMGRIELITDRQRELVATISGAEPSTAEWFQHIPESPARERFFAGDNDAADKLGVPIPKDYQAYLDLGRFRNALIHYELGRTQNPNLHAFASLHGLPPR